MKFQLGDYHAPYKETRDSWHTFYDRTWKRWPFNI